MDVRNMNPKKVLLALLAVVVAYVVYKNYVSEPFAETKPVAKKVVQFNVQPYDPVKINTNLYLVDEAFQEEGKIFAQYDIQQEIKDSVTITLNIEEGNDIYINNAWVSETEVIDSNYIRNEFTFNNSLVGKNFKIFHEIIKYR